MLLRVVDEQRLQAVAQLDNYGMEALVPELNLAAARLARECADTVAARSGVPKFVAGVLGPTNRTASILRPFAYLRPN